MSTDDTLADFGYEQELKRSLRLRDLLVYGLIFMVPIAPFAIFGVVFNASKGMVPLTYVIGLVAMLFTALSYREMSRAFPVAGSVYSYAGRGIAPWVGFLAGWAILLDYLLVPDPALRHRRRRAGHRAARRAAVAVGGDLRGAQHRGEPGRYRDHRAGQPGVPARRTDRAGDLHRGRRHRDQSRYRRRHWSITPLFNAHEFSPSLVFAALSVAVLSFLGFDAISTQSEEVRGGPKVVGRATVISLCLVAVLFIVQTYLAALLVPGTTRFAGEDATNQAFYHVAGPGRRALDDRARRRVLGAGRGRGQQPCRAERDRPAAVLDGAATARCRGSSRTSTRAPGCPSARSCWSPWSAWSWASFFVGQVEFLSTLVNFGALFAFLLLHVSVAVYHLIKRRQHTYGMHLVVPLIGFVIIGYVLYNADTHAKIGGLVWLAVGVVVIVVRRLTGRATELTMDENARA